MVCLAVQLVAVRPVAVWLVARTQLLTDLAAVRKVVRTELLTDSAADAAVAIPGSVADSIGCR